MFVAIKPETVCGLINWKLSEFPSIVDTIQQAALTQKETIFPPAQSALISQLSSETEAGVPTRVLKMSENCLTISDLTIESDKVYEIQLCSSMIKLQQSTLIRELVQWNVIGGLFYPWGEPTPQLGVVENVRT